LREGLGRHPDFISGHVVAGWLSLDRGRPEEAEAQFRAALDLDPQNIAALRALSDILLERGDGLEALGVLEQLSHEDPIDLDLPRRIADLRLQAESAEENMPGQDDEPGSAVWDDPYAVADELDWDGATLQPDESPGDDPGEEAGEDVLGKQGDDSGDDSAENNMDAPEPHALQETALVVEDGEPLPGDEGLQGAMITPTLGEIYLRQGLLDQAEEVFDTLLKADPESLHLQQRLEEVRGLKSGDGDSGEGEEPDRSEEADDLDSPFPVDTPPEETPILAEPMPPGVVPIESLAPDRIFTRPSDDLPSSEFPVPEEPISIEALAPDEPISIDVLAPEEPISIEALAPDEPISIDALAPDEPISIAALAPDDSQGESDIGAFERWLDDLK